MLWWVYVMLSNPINPNGRRTHRTTIYLSPEHSYLIQDEGLNLSEWVRERLNEYFSSEKGLEEKRKYIEEQLSQIKKSITENKVKRSELKTQLNKINSKIQGYNQKRQQISKTGLTTQEFNFLINNDGRKNDWENYNQTFKVNLMYSEFLRLHRQVREIK